MGDYEYLKVQKMPGYCIIGIERKPANALTIKTAVDIADLIDDLSKQDDITAVIITGRIQYSFFTGSDLDEIWSIMNMEGDPCKNMMDASRPVQDAFTRIENSPLITVAAINGVTIGLGTELALACDMRIMSDMAWFRFAQTNIGIIPGAGGTQRLPLAVGSAKAKEFIFTGKRIRAEEALSTGLVNRIVPHGSELKEAISFVEEMLSSSSPNAIKLAKKAINAGLKAEFQEGMDKEMELLGETYAHNDSFEGIKAVMEKRKPVFNLIKL